MADIMLDLETLGIAAGHKILSIGAVAFDVATGQLGEEFYSVISRHEQTALGLAEWPDTLKWWLRQSPEARALLTQSDLADAPTVNDALQGFNSYLAGQASPNNVRLWGNGADFDQPILLGLYRAADVKPAWGTWNNRCYRTIKVLKPLLKLTRTGTHHNALDDAKSQAQHMLEICAALGLTELA